MTARFRNLEEIKAGQRAQRNATPRGEPTNAAEKMTKRYQNGRIRLDTVAFSMCVSHETDAVVHSDLRRAMVHVSEEKINLHLFVALVHFVAAKPMRQTLGGKKGAGSDVDSFLETHE